MEFAFLISPDRLVHGPAPNVGGMFISENFLAMDGPTSGEPVRPTKGTKRHRPDELGFLHVERVPHFFVIFGPK